MSLTFNSACCLDIVVTTDINIQIEIERYLHIKKKIILLIIFFALIHFLGTFSKLYIPIFLEIFCIIYMDSYGLSTS